MFNIDFLIKNIKKDLDNIIKIFLEKLNDTNPFKINSNTIGNLIIHNNHINKNIKSLGSINTKGNGRFEIILFNNDEKAVIIKGLESKDIFQSVYSENNKIIINIHQINKSTIEKFNNIIDDYLNDFTRSIRNHRQNVVKTTKKELEEKFLLKEHGKTVLNEIDKIFSEYIQILQKNAKIAKEALLK